MEREPSDSRKMQRCVPLLDSNTLRPHTPLQPKVGVEMWHHAPYHNHRKEIWHTRIYNTIKCSAIRKWNYAPINRCGECKCGVNCMEVTKSINVWMECRLLFACG